jgi:D-beta-D-heptose 7-phosphate kinase/D-beta-D-heptose 1-phosphate adenosyltransferase
MENLRKLVLSFKGKKILVFGDLMLDEHIWAKVSRISPEGPVPIADVQTISHVPGGSGNVAANIKTLGGEPFLVGIIGKDSSGSKLKKALKALKINTNSIIESATRPTILKSRIIASQQQVVRVDRELKTDPDKETLAKAKSLLQKVIPSVDGIIISDYGKGLVTKELCQTILQAAKKAKIPVSVDPKGSDYSKYAGVTILTPNLLEAETAAKEKATSLKALAEIAAKIIGQVRSDYLLITQGKDGMSLFNKKSLVLQIPALAKEVFDITGAGDTVISTLTLGLAAKLPIDLAVSLANTAASIKVGKVGTAPVYADELLHVLEDTASPTKKIVSREEIKQIALKLKARGKKVVFTNGCFDILHLGHIRYLKEAKNLGDILILGLNSDNSVRRIKAAPRPYVPETERAEIMAALECVDYVCVFDEDTPTRLIETIKPDLHVKGGDYQVDDLIEKEVVKAHGGEVAILSKVAGRSTTNLVEKIKQSLSQEKSGGKK